MKLFHKTIARLLVAASFLVPPVAAVTIRDLTQPFEYGNLDSPFVEELAYNLTTEYRDIRRALLVEDGEIVFEYQRDNIDDSDVYNLWSATKPFMGMLIGHIMESPTYNLTRNSTLEQIFANNPATWTAIENQTEIKYKKSITVYELLTMSSGLTLPLFGEDFNPFDTPNWVGEDLADSMRGTYDTTLRGQWNYLMASNILSYVLLEVTGMTPFEYISSQIFPHVGIDPDGVQWDTNKDGVQTSLSNLRLNGKDFAKLTQLFLQKGEASPGNQVLSREWVEESISFQTHPSPEIDPEESSWHGYFWIGMPLPEYSGNVYCAMGFHGQASCFNYETGRVSVVQRSNTIWDVFNWDFANRIAIEAMSPLISFTSAPTSSPSPTEAPKPLDVDSAVSRLSVSWVVLVSISLVGFYL